jgi:hypothetical protein
VNDSGYTILIGSYARGDASPESDVDVMRIGHQNTFEGLEKIPSEAHVSYIDFDWEDFFELHTQGSLFLYHTFNEGILLGGCKSKWGELKESFRVAVSHTKSIIEYLELLTYIENYPGYEEASIPYLSNIFKAVKNIGIFRLAERGIYRFDKKSALYLGCDISEQMSQALQSANNCFERSFSPSKEQIVQFRDAAAEWKLQSPLFIKNISI